MFKFLFKKPITFLVAIFAVTIFIGAVLLKSPWATFEGISFLDALFMATSATTVTGLAVKNLGADFTLFGQIIVLILIQLGGLGIMSAAAFVFLIFRKIGIRTGVGLKIILEEEYVSGVKRAIKFIILGTFFIEAIGALSLFLLWQDGFSSVFHSVAAFCNAGFSLFNNSLENFRGNILVNFIFSFLIISGGIGFLVLEDFYRKITSFSKKRRVRISLHSKIVLISTIFLILFGASLFYFFEKGELVSLSPKELILVSFFQSISSRTAGFNTVPIGELSNPTLLLLIFLMFIGAAPASTAGGVKVISLAVIFLLIVAFFRKKEELMVFGRIIPKVQIRNVFILVSIYLSFCLVISFFLLYIEKGGFEKILFEVFSATGTVGLSCGVTPHLTSAGKILIIISMFVGRLLPLSLAIAGLREIAKTKILLPEEKIVLG